MNSSLAIQRSSSTASRGLAGGDRQPASTSVTQRQRLVAHGRPVLDHEAHLGQARLDGGGERVAAVGRSLAVDLEVDPRLPLAAAEAEEAPPVSSLDDVQRGVQHDVDAQVTGGQHHR